MSVLERTYCCMHERVCMHERDVTKAPSLARRSRVSKASEFVFLYICATVYVWCMHVRRPSKCHFLRSRASPSRVYEWVHVYMYCTACGGTSTRGWIVYIAYEATRCPDFSRILQEMRFYPPMCACTHTHTHTNTCTYDKHITHPERGICTHARQRKGEAAALFQGSRGVGSICICVCVCVCFYVCVYVYT